MTLNRVLKVIAGIYLVGLIVAVMAYKAAFLGLMFSSPFFGAYSVCVAAYILSRFLFSLFYRSRPDVGHEPEIAIVMPSFNEEDAIAQSLRSLLAVDYPQDKLELIAVNDGSTDSTLQEMQKVAAESGGRVRVIDFPENRGKRAAMAAGIDLPGALERPLGHDVGEGVDCRLGLLDALQRRFHHRRCLRPPARDRARNLGRGSRL